MKFKLETEFQETEIGKIPREWKVVKLRQVAEIRGSKKIGEDIDKVVFIPMEAIPDTGLYVSYEIRNASEVKSFVYCEPGDILLAKITPSFENGKQGIVPDNIPGKFALATTEVYPIKCNGIDKIFLFYLLKYPPIRNKLASLMRGTTGRRRLPREALESASLPDPPIREQRMIAEILSVLDRAIEVVHAGVDRLEDLKKALMRELLTGRIRVREENGKPIFYRETEFQDTEIGKIPREWKVVRLENVLLLLRNGLNAKQNKDGVGYPITRIETISEEKIDVSKVGYVTGLTEVEIEKYKLIEGDILFSHINSLEHIGKAAIYEGVPELLLHGVNLLLLRPDKKKVYPKFLLYLLHLYRERKVFWAMAKRAVNQASINQTELKNMKIFLPPLNEQVRIAGILSTVERAIEVYHEERTRLVSLKQGLMDLLLTGKVRVRED